MKKRNSLYLIITLSCLFLMIGLTTIIFLCIGKYGESLFFIIPAIFLFPMFLTFYKTPENANYHVFKLIVLYVSRFLLAILAILIPALIWYFIPNLKENVASFYLLFPFFEVFLLYNITAVYFMIDSKKQISKTIEK